MKEHLPVPISARYDSKDELTFPKTNSRFYIGTAGTKSFGRGDTISDLHCSELPRWKDPDIVMDGLLEAIPEHWSTEINVEATAQGQGNLFHHGYLDAKAKKNGFKAHFFPWFFDNEYQIIPQVGYQPNSNYGTPEVGQMHNLTVAQMAWRDMKIGRKRGNIKAFLEDYPENDVSCFTQSGNPIFDSTYLVIRTGYTAPVIGKRYVIGADTAEGLATGDWCTATVIEPESGKEIKAIRGKWAPSIFAHKLSELGRLYNNALMMVERNNHGHAVIQKLQDLNYTNMFRGHDGRLGWLTMERNKYMMIDELVEAIRTGEYKIASPQFIVEAAEMQYDEDGKIVVNGRDHHGDTVIATAIAWQGRKYFAGTKIISKKKRKRYV